MKNIGVLNFRIKLFSWTEPSMKIKLTKYFTLKHFSPTLSMAVELVYMNSACSFAAVHGQIKIMNSVLPGFSIQGGWGLVGVVNYNRHDSAVCM